MPARVVSSERSLRHEARGHAKFPDELIRPDGGGAEVTAVATATDAVELEKRRRQVAEELRHFQESGDWAKDKVYREWLRGELQIINAQLYRGGGVSQRRPE